MSHDHARAPAIKAHGPSQQSHSTTSSNTVSPLAAQTAMTVAPPSLGLSAARRAYFTQPVSHPDDPDEHAAERAAEQILSSGSPGVPASPLPSPSPAGSGRPLDGATRAFFEARFGHDFNSVRVHDDPDAHAAAHALGARAFTSGRDLVFDRGQHAPHTAQGQRLLAHELAHVVQHDARPTATVHRVPWTPVRADELNAAGTDRFAAQTFELSMSSFTGVKNLAGTLVTTTQNIDVSVFVPSGATAARNRVHIFFSPGSATENFITGMAAPTPGPAAAVGMNAANTHGFRGASDSTEWILITVPGRVRPASPGHAQAEADGFNTIDTAGITACLTAAGRPNPSTLDALRLSSHSRGSRGLTQTISRRLINTSLVERVVVFDAAFSSLNTALNAPGALPASAQFIAYNEGGSGLTGSRARNVTLRKPDMRAIGYSRLILDGISRGWITAGSVPTTAAGTSQVLPLPARGLFSSLRPPPTSPPGMVNINDWATAHRAQINTIETNLAVPARSLKAFVDSNNLWRAGASFTQNIDAHHLFVTELAHEVTD